MIKTNLIEEHRGSNRLVQASLSEKCDFPIGLKIAML